LVSITKKSVSQTEKSMKIVFIVPSWSLEHTNILIDWDSPVSSDTISYSHTSPKLFTKTSNSNSIYILILMQKRWSSLLLLNYAIPLNDTRGDYYIILCNSNSIVYQINNAKSFLDRKKFTNKRVIPCRLVQRVSRCALNVLNHCKF
jgi:hypothetical protein